MRPHRPLLVALGLTALTVLAAASRPLAGEGQAQAAPGCKLEDLNSGGHVFGPEFSAADALGKIVVVEIGGS